MSKGKTKEAQNQSQIDDYERRGPVTFGPWTSHLWRSDPRHLSFLMARYKFVAKMLAGRENILEVGCGDAAGMPIVLQVSGHVHGIDFEPLVLDDAARRYREEGEDRASFSVHDICEGPVGPEKFAAAYSLDVIEHVPASKEDKFMANLAVSLTDQGVCLIGTPNIHADQYATPASKEGHINLKSAETLAALVGAHFHNVFNFSMNDEVVHTGYAPMAHYLFCLGVGVRR
jgi:2-polyprenyl-3-methyl-5-hydroxy-6-metoxy-1,4-benzoquinol methylase